MLPPIGTILFLGGAALIASENSTIFHFSEEKPVSIKFHHVSGEPFEFGLRVESNKTILSSAERLLYAGNNTLCMVVSWKEIVIRGFLTLQIPEIADESSENARWLLVNGDDDQIVWKVVSDCPGQDFISELFWDHVYCIIILASIVSIACVSIWYQKKRKNEKISIKK